MILINLMSTWFRETKRMVFVISTYKVLPPLRVTLLTADVVAFLADWTVMPG